MKAVHVARFGDVDVLRPVDLAPRPPGPGDTVIAVEASGVNYADLYFRKGAFPGLLRPLFVPGLEGVGTVTRRRPMEWPPVGEWLSRRLAAMPRRW